MLQQAGGERVEVLQLQNQLGPLMHYLAYRSQRQLSDDLENQVMVTFSKSGQLCDNTDLTSDCVDLKIIQFTQKPYFNQF